MSDLNAYLTEKNRQINETLAELLGDTSGRVVRAMRHSLMAGGKRIRPVLCIAAAEAVGGTASDALPAACAIEMIHTYSLIHDDLPAMDDDDLRRGQPTCHVAFDEATAILAGDALLTLAFEVLSSVRTEGQVSERLAVVGELARAAGYNGMIEGQMRDMAAEGRSLELSDLREMHALKTGALIEASVASGAILGQGNADQIAHLRTYARHIGLAFQVTDDILNVEGDPELMGKAVGTDSVREKSTYPAVMGMEQSKKFAKKIICNALDSLDMFDSRSEPLRAIANYIIERRR